MSWAGKVPALHLSSLRWRLLAATLVSLLAALVLTGLLLNRLFQEHVTQQMRQDLTAQLDQVTARLDFDAQGQPVLAAKVMSDPRWDRPFSGLYWQIDQIGPPQQARAGVLRSRSLWDDTLALHADALADGAVHQHEIDGPQGRPLMALERTVRDEDRPENRWRLIAASDIGHLNDAAGRFSGLLALSLGVLFVLLLAAALAQVQIGLAPLQTLRLALQRVRAGQAQYLQGRFPQEVQPLVDEFNGVLTRNAEIVIRARTQAGNLAHAVKTPLAVLRQAAEGASAQPATRALGELIGEQLALAQRQVDWHMARSRAAAAVGIPGHNVAVGPVLQGLVRAMRHIHAGRGLTIGIGCAFAGAADASFAGEEQDVQELLGNLIDNACKWARTTVDIRYGARLGDGAPRLEITVDDDGPGIDAERRAEVLSRGVRLDETAQGTGLGLSIASELVSLYQGRLQLTDSPLGGLRVVVDLPAALAA